MEQRSWLLSSPLTLRDWLRPPSPRMRLGFIGVWPVIMETLINLYYSEARTSVGKLLGPRYRL